MSGSRFEVARSTTAREHRGDMHAIALRTFRIASPEAQVGEGAPESVMKFYGWPEPYPVLDDGLAARRAEAETLTDELVAAAYTVLDDAESAEFAVLLPAALAHLDA